MARKPKDQLTQIVRARLEALMDEHKLTQADLIRASRQRQQDVNRFFRGQMVYPPMDFVDALARVFQHTIADILADVVPEPALTRAEVSVVAAWRSMADEVEQRGLLRLMRRGLRAQKSLGGQTEGTAQRPEGLKSKTARGAR